MIVAVIYLFTYFCVMETKIKNSRKVCKNRVYVSGKQCLTSILQKEIQLPSKLNLRVVEVHRDKDMSQYSRVNYYKNVEKETDNIDSFLHFLAKSPDVVPTDYCLLGLLKKVLSTRCSKTID